MPLLPSLGPSRRAEPPPRADVALAAALAAFGVAEVLGVPVGKDVVGGPLALNVATVLALSVPIAWRRSHPLAVVVVVHAALGLRALFPEPLELYLALFSTLVSAYSLGVHARLRALAPAVAVTAAGLAVAQARGTGGEATPNAVATLVLFGVLWAIGRVIGRRSRESAEALLRAAELDARREREAAEAVAAERRRIARELHDAVSHSLAMITMQAGGAQDVLARDPEQAARSLRAIERAAREGLTEMRQLLGLLDTGEPTSRDPLPGLDRLTTLLENARDAGLTVQLVTTGEPRPLPAAAETSLYRVVQEALTNAARHGGRCTAEVALQWTDTELRLCVVNDLASSTPSPGSGRGLPGLRERVAVLGGRLAAGPGSDGRFRVECVLPLEPLEPLPCR